MIINNAVLVLEDKEVRGSIGIDGAVIDRILLGGELTAKNDEVAIDAVGKFLMPGFVDLHTHGAGGFDFMDGTQEDIIEAAKTHAKHGTTTCLPTSLTSTDADLFLFLENLKAVMAKQKAGNLAACSKMPGAHLEGPYFDMVQKGAQDSRYIQNPTPRHYNAILDHAEGIIARWSVAPELPGALQFIDTVQKNGILVSAGHTNATYEDISKAYDHGLKLLTHFYSGMSTITRKGGFRVLGAIESGYLIDDLFVELICDGMHLPPELLEFIFKLKKHDRITACTDSMRGAGLLGGPSILGPKNNGTACIIEDGIAKMPDRSCFAGSVATGDRLARTLHCIVGLSLSEVTRILCLQPAALIGQDKQIGSIALGKAADLVLCDDNINIDSVFINGLKA